MRNIKVVFFDAGGTLFRPYPSVGHVYAEVALKHGVRLDSAAIEKSFHDVWHQRNGLASLANLSSEKIERDWWHAVVQDVFSPLAPFQDFPTFFDELYEYFATAACWKVFDDALPVLNHLKAEGYRLGVISNWDHRLFTIVEELGLHPHFENIFASAKVGVAKPGKGIFEHALKSFSIEPHQALHIGDSVEEDYYGAQRAGLQAILLDRPRKAYNDVVSVDSLQGLIPLLS